MSIYVNRDGTTEAWDGDNYVALGSMRGSDHPGRTEETFTPPPSLRIVIEEHPAVTIAEFQKLARDQRKQRNREVRFRKMLQKAADLAARQPGVDS